ncbi:ribosome maturation factor RimP [Limisalsivibrio acetivorans]|uniref:ribosome maturation factor RimP n=1 Tax=Limisalsivibrio acetivorans TaxID=1304888 RepID=UPI0003B748D6|nr:ribosome maturation factor RimP [Limisalsivibrio acetivorans]
MAVSRDKEIIEKVRAAAVSVAEGHGVELFDITFRSERGGRVLRIYIDRDNETPGLEECALVSRDLSEILDKEDIIPYERYNLEVSTPGLDRPLRNERDFEKYTGKLCKITMKVKDETGRKNYTGRINGVDNGSVLIYVDKESKEFALEIDNISKARLEIEI